MPRYLFVHGRSLWQGLLTEVVADVIPRLALSVWKNWKQDARCRFQLDTDGGREGGSSPNHGDKTALLLEGDLTHLMTDLLEGRLDHDKITDAVHHYFVRSKRRRLLTTTTTKPPHRRVEPPVQEKSRHRGQRSKIGVLRSPRIQGDNMTPPRRPTTTRPSTSWTTSRRSDARPMTVSLLERVVTGTLPTTTTTTTPVLLSNCDGLSNNLTTPVTVSDRPLVSVTWIPSTLPRTAAVSGGVGTRPSYSRGLMAVAEPSQYNARQRPHLPWLRRHNNPETRPGTSGSCLSSLTHLHHNPEDSPRNYPHLGGGPQSRSVVTGEWDPDDDFDDDLSHIAYLLPPEILPLR